MPQLGTAAAAAAAAAAASSSSSSAFLLLLLLLISLSAFDAFVGAARLGFIVEGDGELTARLFQITALVALVRKDKQGHGKRHRDGHQHVDNVIFET